MSIHYFNRMSGKIEEEKVLGGTAVDWAYKDAMGLRLTDKLFSKPWLSHLMGVYENSPLSKRQITKFIAEYNIDMNLFEEEKYAHFNQFFIRKFKPGVRSFDPSPEVFSAGAEARYLAYENITADARFHIKGIEIDLPELFRNKTLAKEFDGGALMIARLCPVDYHRFHFPCEGQIDYFQRVAGDLHSVNPVALVARPDIFLKNERQITCFTNAKFGRVAMIEVGALGVGKIVQSGPKGSQQFSKGDEKGYFLFGGSTVIWVTQKGRLKLADDLAQNSKQGLETWIPLGETLGRAT